MLSYGVKCGEDWEAYCRVEEWKDESHEKSWADLRSPRRISSHHN